MMRRWIPVVLLLALTLGGCPKSSIGIAVKAGEVTKQSVELAMDEVIALGCGGVTDQELAQMAARGTVCVRRMSKADFDRAAEQYGRYEILQRGAADALIAWTRVKNAENDQKYQTALAQVRAQMQTVMALACSFESASTRLADICVQVRAGG